MLDERRMSSLLKQEFVPCGSLTLEDLETTVLQCCQAAGVPAAAKKDSVKAGLLSKDPCLVFYNPQNLDYHTIVMMIRTVNGTRMFSLYSAGTAAALHIGGGLLNVEHQKNKLSGVLKSGKQKLAEEEDYNNRAIQCVIKALEIYGFSLT